MTDDQPNLEVPHLLTPGEVAALFRVDPKTVTRWAAIGRLSSLRTPGGHRRFRADEVRAALNDRWTAATNGPKLPKPAAEPVPEAVEA